MKISLFECLSAWIAGLFFLVSAIALITPSVRSAVNQWIAKDRVRIFVIPLVLLTAYSIIAVSNHQWDTSDFIRYAFYYGIVASLIYWRGLCTAKANIFDIIVVCALWLPYELRQFSQIPLKITMYPGVIVDHFDYPFLVLAGIIYMTTAFQHWRPFELYLSWRVTIKDFLYIIVILLILAAVVIPIGLSISFLKFGIATSIQKIPFPLYIFPTILGFAIFVALPEELLFRGYILNLLLTRFTVRTSILFSAALYTSALIFGLSHIHKVVFNIGFPNWPYFFFSAIAGIAYGYIYYQRKSLTAAIVLHALTDALWIFLFRGA